MNALITVMRKELLDLFRDRKTIAISLAFTLLAPLLILGMAKLANNRMSTQLEKPLELPVIGAERAPNLINWLSGRNVLIKPAPANPEGEIAAQNVEVILSIPADYAEKWRAGEPAPVEVISDSSRDDARIPTERLNALLDNYSRSAGALRLLARGVSPSAGQAVLVERKDLATPESRIGQALAFLPYLLILSGFLGGAYLVIDATAGERERQSLEPLLATPAARGAIMSGKIAAACVFGMFSLVLTLLAFKGSFVVAGAMGLKLGMGWAAVGQILVVLLPIVLIGTCLLTLIAAGAKSVKEAQSYMSALMMLPIIPTVVLMVNPIKNQLWQFAVPFLSQNQLILKIVRSESVSSAEWAVYLAAGFGLGAVLWWLAARRYHDEKLAVSG
ncbi:sodium ABC transporter permease [Arenimonas maotaiensis]|uniref:Sodium ABC transporter permease n=1 Tax=Arenimonas maotaiensis TaxID=1446479 RepID=A0A917CRM0_9GAMM|nr:ABC transporter permease [Arenimonas maotaiensis]GGF94747.1 sodium ABC transporter permease [Arenimonas maotaiensis]